MAQHNDFGKWGEDRATEFLQQAGYELITRNYRFKRDEVDIIMKFKEMYIFVEVKTRSKTHIQEPEESVTKAKQKRIIKVAHQYLIDNELNNEARFDIITITKQQTGFEVNHIEDAFMPQW